MIYSNTLGCSKEIQNWLMSEDSPPPVRYLTILNIIKEPVSDDRHTSKEDVLNWPPLKRIMELQQEDGGFPVTQKGKPGIPTFFALILMSKCGLDCSDEPVRRAIEYIEKNYSLNNVISWNSGGSGILPCYAGVTASHISRMSCGRNDLVNGVADWIVKHQRYDHKDTRAGGDEEWNFCGPSNFGCWQSVSCYHGVVASLSLLASIPSAFRTPEIRSRIKEALRYLEIHRVFRKTKSGEPMFRHMTNFFIFGQWRMNLLDIVETILDAEPETAAAPWLHEALEEIDRHCVEGRIIHKTEYRTFLVDPPEFESTGVPSYFLTYQWLRLLNRVEKLSVAV